MMFALPYNGCRTRFGGCSGLTCSIYDLVTLKDCSQGQKLILKVTH